MKILAGAAIAKIAAVAAKPRRVLTDEEKAERKKKRREIEEKKRKEREKQKKERKIRLWKQHSIIFFNIFVSETKHNFRLC